MDIVRSTILDIMKIPHFGRHEEVKVCIKIPFSCFHGDYIWLDRCIIVNLALIHQITRLSMQGPDPQDFYPGKDVDHALTQRIKDTYVNVEKGK
jgi:hypothetical protein